MPADVNVTERVARALVEYGGRDWQEVREAHQDARGAATAALSVLADPDVLAGIAGVLREHGQWLDETACPDGTCDCGAEGIEDHEAHQAAAVVEWLRGERA